MIYNSYPVVVPLNKSYTEMITGKDEDVNDTIILHPYDVAILK